MPQLPGLPLNPFDLDALLRSGIDADLAERALIRSVDSATGAEVVCRNGSGDYSGILFPYVWPGENRVRDYRLRLRNPPGEYRNGVLKPTYRYLSPLGRTPMLYFGPDTDPAWLADSTMTIILNEGEKKTLALDGLAWHGLGDIAEQPRWLAIGIPGVWSWRGKRGRTEAADGEWQSVKGPIADLDRIVWRGRRVIILFDTNVHTNPKVRWARSRLAEELRERGALVSFVDLPADAGVNGVDDLVCAWGADRVLNLMKTQTYDPATRSVRVILTEIGNAERLAKAYGDDLRYCHQTNEWLVWDDKRFAPDQIATVERYAKETVRQLGADALNIESKEQREAQIKFATKSDSDRGIHALLNRAAAEEGVPVLMNDLDADPWLLNVENGTIDLRTGELRPHSRDDLISKLAPVRFDPSARCPRWMSFLDEVFEPHPDAPAYLQRAVGYALTGDIREECLFLMYGTGRNGKGTIFRTLLALLGDYADTADFATFVAARDERGPRDGIANMRGRRLVTSQEPSQGVPLNEGLVKWITGGDMVRARNLYERSSEWMPTHHLFLAVNHKPVIRGTDVGIWSRIRLIPFGVSFLGREDKTLKETLPSELPGILNWCIEGCLAWQRDGLGECESVETATQSYRVESDQVGRFIEDECDTLPFMQVAARKLYAAYRYWAERSGEDVLTETGFGLSLTERGFPREHKRTGSVYFKIGLRSQADEWAQR